MRRTLWLLLLVPILAACGPSTSHETPPATTGHAPTKQSAPGLARVHDPGIVTGHYPVATCHFRDAGTLPDPNCTPGAIDPAVTQANIDTTICRSGYTESVRPTEDLTEKFKYDVAYPDYGVPQSATSELDHLVPLELGGSNDALNLWPEVGPLPNPKDSVEDALNHAVCSGKVTLAGAQIAIARNWHTAEQVLGLN